ncbi:MAG: hypothetical protein A2078_12185 [Nitrospirae bacterium GWC2_57_9]|nr:MAG: hypothetical protein A2078_12185 [Nitrospirae bacterium GWC2_57_9]
MTRLPAFLLCISVSLLMLPFIPGSTASAVTLDGSSRSYLQTRESGGGSRLIPGYEYLDLSAGDLAGEAVSVHFGGWARYDFEQENAKSNIQYAFVSYRRKEDNTLVDLGRVLVFEGVAAAERVDGAYARTDLARNFSLSAFGGVPAETGIDLPGASIIYGARLSHQLPDLYRLGISALREEKNDDDFREEAGVDLWLRPLAAVELTGRSNYDSVSRDWMEHSYYLSIAPLDKFRFNTEAAWYRYESLFRTTTTAALQFGPGLLDPNETATILGEEVAYTATDRVSVFANVRLYSYEIAGNATSFGGRINYSQGRGNAAGLSINRVDGDDARLQYTQYRLYGSRRFGKITLAADLIDVEFDENTAGDNNAYSASLITAYDLMESLRLGADVEYLNSALLEDEVRALLKIIYTFGFKFGGGA